MAPNDAVYATLLINDAYLPGAMVLGHSLKDKGAKAKLVVLAVMENLAATTIADLKTVYDDVVPVQQISNSAPAHLYLMGRPDLLAAFTKIQLWQQTQYKRIVYIDADVVALRAPNELLKLDTEFAAVPDIGWPDCFNSGVMVLNPNMADYYALLALAERGISFDGADQGLLNMHFTEWERLSFKYNCTPSGNYQYAPAYRHFQSTINLVHFIGRDKPWTLGRQNRISSGVYSELLGRWWAVYDKHYRARETVYYDGEFQQAPKKIQDYVAGEETMYLHASQAPPPTVNVHPPPEDLPAGSYDQPLGDQPTRAEQISSNNFEPTPTVEQRRWSAPHAEWQPAMQPPPTNSKPEASNFPTQTYEFSEDVKLFRPPVSYPEAPKDMWYQVPPKIQEEPKLKPIFPWEAHAPKPTRVFPQTKSPTPPREPTPPEPTSEYVPAQPEPQRRPSQTSPFISNQAPPQSLTQIPTQTPAPPSTDQSRSPPQPQPDTEPQAQPRPKAQPPKMSLANTDATDVTALKSPTTPIEPFYTPKAEWVNPWETFNQRTNAWDDMPEIVEYVQALQPPKRGKIQVLHHIPSTTSERRDSVRVTDFPTEVERPSLPVTPAPIRRPTFWGDEADMSGELPTADGVPKQSEWVRRFSSYPKPAFSAVSPLVHESNGTLWCRCQHCGTQNPIAKLEELQRRQSEALLGRQDLSELKDPPKRDLPDSASRQDVEAAVEKATSPLSVRPLKPILREPHFELSEKPDDSSTTNMNNSVHDDVTEEAISPNEIRDSTSNLSTPRPEITA